MKFNVCQPDLLPWQEALPLDTQWKEGNKLQVPHQLSRELNCQGQLAGLLLRSIPYPATVYSIQPSQGNTKSFVKWDNSSSHKRILIYSVPLSAHNLSVLV